MNAIEKALVLILEDLAGEYGSAAYCSVINRHFSTQEEAIEARKRARKKFDDVIKELKS